MSCALRIKGSSLDIDALFQRVALSPESTWRKGDPKIGPWTNSDKHHESGANYLVSDAEFDDFESQKSEAIEYLKQYWIEIKEILSSPGLEGAALDFGIYKRDVAAQFNYIPAKLIRLAGVPCMPEKTFT